MTYSSETEPRVPASGDRILQHVRRGQPQMIALLKELVECESPSDSPEAINWFVDLLVERTRGMAKAKIIRAAGYGNHLRLQFQLPGRKKEGQILGLGHSDTVWPLGTLRSMPFRQKNGRLWGPGVLDMKAGLVFFLYAAKALRDLDLPARRNIVLQINSDEEIGSPSSRSLTEAEAKRSAAVLVLEPGTGLTGKLKTARKGVGNYTVTVYGKSSHAGVDFTNGVSAILELARQLGKIETFTDLKRGITVNPGIIAGGTRTNVIAAEARAEIDVRIARSRDSATLERKFHQLRTFDRRCRLEITGGLNRPPMERTREIRALFAEAQTLAREIGIDLEESSTGGGSDGNFTAALGVPTLDGLGAVGEGAHALNESILIDRMADRIALIAKLLQAL